MPNRILREGILSSERVDSLDAGAELFYRRVMSVVDDFGRFSANPQLLASACYPLRARTITDAEISGWLAQCARAGLLVIYTGQGKVCLELVDFRQRRRAGKSRFPDPDDGRPADSGQSNDSPLPVNGQSDDGHMPDDGPSNARLGVCVFEGVDVGEGEGEGVARAADSPPAAIHLPAYLKPASWARFCDGCVKAGKPLDHHRAVRVLQDLAGFKAQGYDAQALLAEAAARGWTWIRIPDRAPASAPNQARNSSGETLEEILRGGI